MIQRNRGQIMLIRRWLFGLLAAATVAALAYLPAAPASANVLPPDGGSCGGLIITPSRPAPSDWSHGVDLKLWNCSKSTVFANVICHPWPTFVPDGLCWTYVIRPGDTQDVSVGTFKQVHAVAWYH
jgi:hypothetical protein